MSRRLRARELGGWHGRLFAFALSIFSLVAGGIIGKLHRFQALIKGGDLFDHLAFGALGCVIGYRFHLPV